jgi:hypothetical protein
MMDQGVTQHRSADLHGHVVYAKTDDGRKELLTRSLTLPHKLRSLLVMIDGRQTAQTMLEKLHPLGVDADSFVELERLGLIEPVYIPPAPEIEPPTPEVEPPAPKVVVETAAVATTIPVMARLEPAAEAVITTQSPELLRLFEVRNFYQRTIRDTIGGLGFMLQIDIENATTLEECRALRERFLNAAQRTTDDVTVQKLDEELNHLFGPSSAA